MSKELEEIVEKIREKYGINGVKEPLLSQENIVYLLWRLKGLIWNESIKELDKKVNCDLSKYVDHLFDELSSISKSWLQEAMSFNSECLPYISNKKIIEIFADMLILRNVYFELSKSY